MNKARLDIRIPKDVKDRLEAIKKSRGIGYTNFIVLALREKFDRLDNPDNYLNPNSPKLNGIREEISELKEMIKKERIEFYRITELLKRKDFKGTFSTGIEEVVIAQLESPIYNGIPKTIKSIFDRLIKDGHNFTTEEVVKVLNNSERISLIKNGNIQGYLLREEATKNE